MQHEVQMGGNVKTTMCCASALATVAMVLVAGSAGAQTLSTAGSPADQTANPSTESAPDEIVVTAQKREQRLIDVPASVSVVGGATLERQQATGLSDYAKLVPGLQLNASSPGQARLVLRGVNTGSISSTVAVYQDETVFGSSSGLINGATLTGDFDTFDIARIEVLRGPQGTLYGANALSGLIKFVPNAPNATKFEARARGGVEATKGGELSYSGNALVNLPLSDSLAVRASGYYNKRGGFIDSIGTGGSAVAKDINGYKSYGGRVSVLFEPTDKFSISAMAYLQNLDVDADDTVEANPINGATLYGRYTHSQFAKEYSRTSYRIYSGVAKYDLDFAELISATSYSTLRQDNRADFTPVYSALVQGFTGLPNQVFFDQPQSIRRFSQEVRLQSPAAPVFEWQIGGYYNHERGSLPGQLTAAVPGTTTPIAVLGDLGTTLITSRYREIAGFANATLHLGQRFDLTFGGRYSHNKQVADQLSDSVLLGGLTVFPTARSSENVFTYSVSPKIKLGDRVSVYARVAKGFRPGGPNVLPPGAPAGLGTYKSDSLISYEAGIKAETTDRTFAIDAAAFHIDWSDIQVFGVVNSFGINFNGGKAVSNGFEFTATLRPTRGLVASFNGAYTDAWLKDDTPTDVGGRAGDQLPYTPKMSVAANFDYDWSLGTDTTAYVGGSIRMLGRQTGSYNAALVAAFERQPSISGYEVVDLRAGLRFPRFSVEAYARNVGNTDGKTSLDTLGRRPLGAATAGVIRPRSIGVTLGASF